MNEKQKKLSCSKKSFLLTTLNSITLNCEKKCDECALFAKKIIFLVKIAYSKGLKAKK